MRDPKHIENSTEFREDSDDEVIVEQDKHGVMVERGDVI
jgi:hypothetical protein